MAQNFLYMFEFVVDDLLITRPNFCAPEEYPTCCEISFRSSVFVVICDREYGECVDPCSPKCGKCCLFSLESPVTDKDRLLIHIYKKKTDKCKFLVGATELPIKSLFDKVTESFHIENPDWMEAISKHNQPQGTKSTSKTAIVDNDCDDEGIDRKEQFCPTSEMTKRLLPLFNMKGCQTGNVVLIMRLVCNGPAIVSTFPFSKVCSQGCGPRKSAGNGSAEGQCPSGCNGGNGTPPGCPPPKMQPRKNKSGCVQPDSCEKKVTKRVCHRYFACNADKGCPCEECEDDCDRVCPTVSCNKKKNKQKGGNNGRSSQHSPSCSCQPDKKGKDDKSPCQRFFAKECDDKSGSDDCTEECEADESSDDECSDQQTSQDKCTCMEPYVMKPTKPEPGPEAYEEFEACLNGSGITIRVLKDTHQVANIDDGTANNLPESPSDDDMCPRDQSRSNQSFADIVQSSRFARNHINRLTAGKIINHPKLPKIRANIKYSGNETCGSQNFMLPLPKMAAYCDDQKNKIDSYRRKSGQETVMTMLPKHAEDIRNCCIQVDPQDIKCALDGINADTRKKGIEVCYKTCDDTDSDVFLVKLGSKQKRQNKKNQIEIELKTPKMPFDLARQKMTTETQITEAELDAAMKKGKRGKRGKGGKGAKGAKGGKGGKAGKGGKK